jgi:nicotinamidase/pyrazinamidase
MAESSTLALQPGDALLVVDVQNDFLPGGRLPVAHGDEVVAVLNAYIARFQGLGLPVFASRDWHPADHCSFVAQGGPWPVHCVADEAGAQFAPGLALPPHAVVIDKAAERAEEAYSAFHGTDLAERLSRSGVRRVFVGGLATDYCVLNTVLDARRLGFDAIVLEDAVRAVEVRSGDGARAIAAMLAAGAGCATLADLERGPAP